MNKVKLKNKTQYNHVVAGQRVRAGSNIVVEDGTDYNEEWFEEINGTDTGAKILSKPESTKKKKGDKE